MKNISETTDQSLKAMYEKWLEELTSRPETELLLGKNFSNPYFISTPCTWHKAKTKILMVGQEGHGEFGSGKQQGWSYNDIEKIQGYNRCYLYVQWNSIHDNEYEYNKSCFWNAFRKIKEKAEKANTTVSCAWSNIDKIHRLGHGSNNCALKIKQRKALHSLTTKVLLEEIRILQPDYVIFLGTHYDSLEHELGKTLKQKIVYEWKENPRTIAIEEFEYTLDNSLNKTTKLILRYYHPNARIKDKSDYEIDFLKKIIFE